MLGLSRKKPMAIFLEEVGIEVDLKFVNWEETKFLQHKSVIAKFVKLKEMLRDL